jgi:hypothetical protein
LAVPHNDFGYLYGAFIASTLLLDKTLAVDDNLTFLFPHYKSNQIDTWSIQGTGEFSSMMVTAPTLRENEASQIAMLTLLGPLPGTGYHLKKAIVVQVERDEGGTFVVSEASTGAFHYGNDLPHAVAGFVSAFVEEFEHLLKHENSLSIAMKSDLEQFRSLLEPSAK